MRKRIRETICALVPNKNAKSKVRHYIGALHLYSDIKNALSFQRININPNTIMVIEPNECHGECLCSYLKYFKDLGFNTHLITTPSVMKLKPLFELPKKYFPEKIFQFSPQQFPFIFNLKKLEDYSHIFLCSTHNYFYDKSNIEALNIPLNLQQNMILMEHDLRHIKKYKEDSFVQNKKLFVITNFENDKNIKTLSPHFFPYENEPKKKEAFTKFITIGALDLRRRNISILFDAVENLAKDDVKNFKITVIGGGKVENIPKEIVKFFEIKSRLSFPDMQKELMGADYILPLLDPTIEANRDYLQFLTTGTKQLILGFRKPCIINEEFAEALGFNSANSLIYSQNFIYEQMKNAIFMDEEEYSHMTEKIKELANTLEQISLNNLKEALYYDFAKN